jgi:hypothetical protein
MYLKTIIAILASLVAVKLEQRWNARTRTELIGRPSINAPIEQKLFIPESDPKILTLADNLSLSPDEYVEANIIQVLLYEVFVPAVARGLPPRDIKRLLMTKLPWEQMGIDKSEDPDKAKKVVDTAMVALDWYRHLNSLIVTEVERAREGCYRALNIQAITVMKEASKMIAGGVIGIRPPAYPWEIVSAEIYFKCSGEIPEIF